MSESIPTRSAARHRARRVRFAPAAIIGGVAASAVVALSMSGTLAGFVAQITNNNNTAATGSLTMRETGLNNGAPVTCDSNSGSATINAVNCAINKFGGSTTMVPDQSITSTITITNTGSVPASTFTLTPAACAQSNSGTVNGSANDACSKVTVSLTQNGTNVAAATGTLASLNNKIITLTPLAAGASSTFAFTVKLPTQNNTGAPTADNAYQGLKVTQDLAWAFTS